jgi:thiol:disulfide interchange protein
MKVRVNFAMMFKVIVISYILSLLISFTPAALSVNLQPQKKYSPVVDYDPKRNASEDIQQAIAEAKKTRKNVLLEVGGKWCIWCRIMDEFFQKNADILELRERNYVTVKINYSPENENKEALSRYPEVPAYPHLFVLDSSGKLLHSQFTGDLEEAKGYNRDKLIAFLKQWAPSK